MKTFLAERTHDVRRSLDAPVVRNSRGATGVVLYHDRASGYGFVRMTGAIVPVRVRMDEYEEVAA